MSAKTTSTTKTKSLEELENYLDYLVTFLQECVKEAHAQGVIVGVSGGVDSAVVALLAKKAFPTQYQTVWMPLKSSSLDYESVQQLIQNNDLNNIEINLESSFELLTKTWKNSGVSLSPLALANAKARLRMTTLYALGQSLNYLVLGTDNADEWYLGYFTKYGDGAVDVVPLIHLLKGEVFAAAKILGVPEIIIQRPPTASLWEGQTDEKEIGFSYEEIDSFLKGQNQDFALRKRLEALHSQSEHKRQLPKKPEDFQNFKAKSSHHSSHHD